MYDRRNGAETNMSEYWKAFLPRLIVTALAVSIVVVIVVLAASTSPNAPMQYIGAFFAGCNHTWWLMVLAAVPPLLIAQYGVFLITVEKDRKLAALKRPLIGSGTSVTYLNSRQNRQRAIQHARLTSDITYYYGLSGVSLDFFLPALLTLLVGMSVSLVITGNGGAGIVAPSSSIMTGVLYGACGAYVYVMTTLFSRYFQRDLTPGLAYWTAASLCLGPILGGLTKVLVDPSPPATAGAATPTASGISIRFEVLYFFAGLSSREVISLFKEAARRLWSGAVPAEPTYAAIPLTRIRGITAENASRLQEEGVTCVTALAYANPMQLIRNTPYTTQEIVAWMDEALLYQALPPSTVQSLLDEGIQGAIAVAYFQVLYGDGAEALKQYRERTKKLATKVKMEEDSFRDLSVRLYYDTQVSLVWLLSDLDGDDERGTTPPPQRIRPRQTTDPAGFRDILQVVAPDFSTSAVGDGGMELIEQYAGRTGVVRTHPITVDTSCVLSLTNSPFAVPAAGRTVLRIIVSYDPRGDWVLNVKLNGTVALTEIIGPATTTDGWAEFVVDLSPFAGQSIPIECENAANRWAWDFAYWGYVGFENEE